MLHVFKFAIGSILKGETVLIYKGVTATKKKDVRETSRLTYAYGIMYLDGISCKGYTVALKPRRIK